MNIIKKQANGQTVAVVESEDKLIVDVQSALDFIMSVQYETQCNRIVIGKEAITEDFFVLSTKLAGEILQKFINYHVKFAIYGDFSQYTSKPLKDFIYECNHGNDIFFADHLEAAVDLISKAN